MTLAVSLGLVFSRGEYVSSMRRTAGARLTVPARLILASVSLLARSVLAVLSIQLRSPSSLVSSTTRKYHSSSPGFVLFSASSMAPRVFWQRLHKVSSPLRP